MKPRPIAFALATFGLSLTLAFSSPAADKVFNVLDYGARGDGTTLDTAAIQRTIDAAAAAGNGARVLIPKGHTFLISTLELRANIDFHIQAGAELVISTNRADYASDGGVLTALNAKNLTISGKGKFMGRALSFMTGYDAKDEWWLFQEWRPKMFILTGCTNLVVRDITFGDAPEWGLHMLGCHQVLVDGIKIRNHLDVPNCDGIDPDHCTDVLIKNCDIRCGDDAIVVKNTRQTKDYGPSANIRVQDCVMETQDSGLKIGTETTSDIRDILFERCEIRCNRCTEPPTGTAGYTRNRLGRSGASMAGTAGGNESGDSGNRAGWAAERVIDPIIATGPPAPPAGCCGWGIARFLRVGFFWGRVVDVMLCVHTVRNYMYPPIAHGGKRFGDYLGKDPNSPGVFEL